MPAPGLPAPTPAQLRGEELYGDDFTAEQVEQWFRDEAEAFFEMSGDSQDPARYGYRELNQQALLRYIPASRRFQHALGLGSGYGTELAPLARQTERVTIVESSEGSDEIRPWSCRRPWSVRSQAATYRWSMRRSIS